MKKRAQLSDGRVIEYVHKDKPPAGGMKKVYFMPDKKYALCFTRIPMPGAIPTVLPVFKYHRKIQPHGFEE